MSKNTFFPYQALQGVIKLQLSSQDPQFKDMEGNRIPVHRSEARELKFHATATLPPKLLEQVLAPHDRTQMPVEVRLVLNGLEARQRQSTRLVLHDGVYQRSLVLRRGDWCGKVDIRALIVRTTTDASIPDGFARDRGAVLASSQVIEMLFDEPTAPPPGGLLNIQWIDFAKSEVPWLRNQAQDLFALDTDADPPGLFLNKGLLHAYPTLSASGHNGPRARLRDLTFGLIVHQVWTSLLGTALVDLASIVRDAGGEPPELGELRSWQQAVIKDWVQGLFPESDQREEALDLLFEALRAPTWPRDLLLQRIPRALQEKFKTGHKLTQAAAEVLEA